MGKKVSKKVKVVKKYVEEGLEAKGLTQADLAQMIDRDYKYVNNCLNAGEISERILEKIGAVIDRMPAYLMGEPMIFPDEVYGYSLHEQQDSFLINKMKKDLEDLEDEKVTSGTLRMRWAIDALIYFSFIGRKDEMKQLSAAEKKEMLWRAVHAADAYYMEVMMGKEI